MLKTRFPARKGLRITPMGFLSFIAIGAISLATITITDNDKAKAEVNQLQGVYVFVDSKPVKEYQYLGTVKNGMRLAGSAQYQPVRDKLLKKLKEDYPQADGAIFSFVNGAADRVDAIKFKD